MRSLIPGRFHSAVVRSDGGELEARLSDGGNCPEGVSTRILDSHVTNTRRKLRLAGLDGFIVNRRGLGYKFCNGTVIDAEPPRRQARSR